MKRFRTDEPAPGTVSRRALYERRKAALIEFLGGQCVNCGRKRKLTFDHISGHRDWDPRRVHSTKRLRIYTEEALNDLLQLLCVYCNSAKGDSPEDDEAF